MLELLGRVVESTSRYNMFGRGDRVGVAVSGGADSVCLLRLLEELARQWNLSLAVLHLDHQLRGADSEADAAFVAELAERFRLPFHLRRVNVAAVDDNLEQAARDARRAFFREVRAAEGLRCVATGHTQSDQAETVLFRLLRGAGTAGLSGIRPVTPDGLVRPLLDIHRAEVEAWLRENGVPWREDATNIDPSFARNRIRHHLLPELIASWNPQLPAALAHMATLAQEDEQYWTGQVEAALASVVQPDPESRVVIIQSQLLEGLPRALARRVIRAAIETVRGDLRGVNFGHVEQILQLAAAQEGHGRLQAPGLDVFRSFEWLRLAPPASHPFERDYEFPLTVPCRIALPPVSIELDVVRSGTTNCDYNEKEAELDWDCLSGPLALRNWRPGDRYRPVGCAGDQKIKFLFQETRVPLWERRRWPVMTAGGQIVWARRFGPAQHCAINPATTNFLRIRIFPAVK